MLTKASDLNIDAFLADKSFKSIFLVFFMKVGLSFKKVATPESS